MSTDSVSIGTISDSLGISGRRVQQLVQIGVLPAPVQRGVYDRGACLAAYDEYLEARAAVHSGSARLVLMNARLRLLQMRVVEKESQLVSLDLVKRTAREMHALAVKLMDEARVRLVPLLCAEGGPLCCDRILADEIRHICLTLSAEGARRASHEAAGAI